jgi:hypothetical protein
MMKLGTVVLVGSLLSALPLNAQSHGAHQHPVQKQEQAGAPDQAAHKSEHEHCAKHAEKHAAKHGAQAGDAAHGSHGAHAARESQGGHASHGAAGANGGMMEQHRTAPKMLLKHRDMLELTAAQVEQLEGLQAAHKADCEKRMAAVKAAESSAAAALASDTPDLGTYEAKLREAANTKVDCKVDMARISQAGAALLTDAQRAHLAHMQHAAH